MEIPKVVSWVSDSDFSKENPIVGKIEAIEQGTNQWGKPEIVLKLDISGNKRQISLFGDNRNQVIDKLGTDGDKWLSKSIQITQLTNPTDGRKIKQIRGL